MAGIFNDVGRNVSCVSVGKDVEGIWGVLVCFVSCWGMVRIKFGSYLFFGEVRFRRRGVVFIGFKGRVFWIEVVRLVC